MSQGTRSRYDLSGERLHSVGASLYLPSSSRIDPLANLSEEQILDLAREQLMSGQLKQTMESKYITRISTNGQSDNNINVPVNLPKFRDGVDMDVDEWLDKFELIATAASWSYQKMLQILPLYLEENAQVWFKQFNETLPKSNEMKELEHPSAGAKRDTSESLQKEYKTRWEEIKQAMSKQYQNRMKSLRLRAQLNSFHQCPQESVSQYYLNLTKLIRRFEKGTAPNDTQITSYFVNGLLPIIKEKVLMAVDDNTPLNEVLEKAKTAEFSIQATYAGNQMHYNYMNNMNVMSAELDYIINNINL
jgi:hypothetical protein